jgi:hypothetical protein
MGQEWYLLHDATLEAYELGGGDWRLWEQAMPTSRLQVVATVIRACGRRPDPDLAWVDRFAAEIWAFVESHPRCYLHDDDQLYFERDRLEIEDCEDEKLFRLVGSSYPDAVLDADLNKPRAPKRKTGKPKQRVRRAS